MGAFSLIVVINLLNRMHVVYSILQRSKNVSTCLLCAACRKKPKCWFPKRMSSQFAESGQSVPPDESFPLLLRRDEVVKGNRRTVYELDDEHRKFSKLDIVTWSFFPAGVGLLAVSAIFPSGSPSFLLFAWGSTILGFISFLKSSRRHFGTISKLDFCSVDKTYLISVNSEIRTLAPRELAPIEESRVQFERHPLGFPSPRYLKVQGHAGRYHFHPKGQFDLKFIASYQKSARRLGRKATVKI